MQPAISKYCLQCNKTVKGRTDKKFCDDYCRNNYNNQLKSATGTIVRNINNALIKNRRILERLLPPEDEMIKVNRHEMLQQGYRFRFNTHSYINKKGAVYHFCYDYGYLVLENDCCLIVKSREE